MSATEADREKVQQVLWHGTVAGTEARVLAWVAEEREKARAEASASLAHLMAVCGVSEAVERKLMDAYRALGIAR